jgi:hypothetical protein
MLAYNSCEWKAANNFNCQDMTGKLIFKDVQKTKDS